MLLYFFTCISFLFLLKSLPLWANEKRLVSFLFYKDLAIKSTIDKFFRKHIWISLLCHFLSIMSDLVSKCDSKLEEAQEFTVLDLPELALDCIIEKLSPSALCIMAGVCSSLRERCVSDHFWKKHMKAKWGRVLGPSAYREWQCHTALSFPWTRSQIKSDFPIKQTSLTPADSIMSWYIALETQNFCFPAQVYNRENGHVGFMLSCYDCQLSYDSCTDTFKARYPPHGKRETTIENDIPWERIRAAPVDTPSHDLHISDCLNELHPGDHIEIQWRRNKEFPYGWWYGVIGHLDLCNGTELYCRCHNSESVVLEFQQYTPGSRWRHKIVSRKDHREEGNESDGFYGGIRKLCREREISTWKRLWPQQVLE